jgi:hypothetical protein
MGQGCLGPACCNWCLLAWVGKQTINNQGGTKAAPSGLFCCLIPMFERLASLAGLEEAVHTVWDETEAETI